MCSSDLREAGGVGHIVRDHPVGHDRPARDRGAEHQPLEGLAAAQGDIDLPVREGRPGLDWTLNLATRRAHLALEAWP